MPKYFALIVLILVHGATYAKVVLDRADAASNPRIHVTGEIRKGDYDDFVEAVRKAYQQDQLASLYLELNTPGGNVFEAMRIGQLVRAMQLTTVNVGGLCDSACLFILIAGAERLSAGGIGIHRPYFDRDKFAELGPNEAEQSYKQLLSATKQYLTEMGAPNALLEKMYQVPSSEVYRLSLDQTESWIPNSPASIDEWLIAKCGSYSKQESADYNAHMFNGRRLSSGYVKYLNEKINKVDGCRAHTRAEVRKATVQKFFSEKQSVKSQ